MLKVIDQVLVKYNGMSEEKRRVTRFRLKVQFGNGEMKDIGKIMQELSTYTSAITLFLNLVSMDSQGKVEQHMETHGDDLRELRQSLNWITATLQANSGNREGSILTNYVDDDKAIWKEFRRELLKEGFSSSELSKHKAIIKDYVMELGARGALDVPVTEDPNLETVDIDKATESCEDQNSAQPRSPQSTLEQTEPDSGYQDSIGPFNELVEENMSIPKLSRQSANICPPHLSAPFNPFQPATSVITMTQGLMRGQKSRKCEGPTTSPLFYEETDETTEDVVDRTGSEEEHLRVLIDAEESNVDENLVRQEPKPTQSAAGASNRGFNRHRVESSAALCSQGSGQPKKEADPLGEQRVEDPEADDINPAFQSAEPKTNLEDADKIPVCSPGKMENNGDVTLTTEISKLTPKPVSIEEVEDDDFQTLAYPNCESDGELDDEEADSPLESNLVFESPADRFGPPSDMDQLSRLRFNSEFESNSEEDVYTSFRRTREYRVSTPSSPKAKSYTYSTQEGVGLEREETGDDSEHVSSITSSEDDQRSPRISSFYQPGSLYHSRRTFRIQGKNYTIKTGSTEFEADRILAWQEDVARKSQGMGGRLRVLAGYTDSKRRRSLSVITASHWPPFSEQQKIEFLNRKLMKDFGARMVREGEFFDMFSADPLLEADSMNEAAYTANRKGNAFPNLPAVAPQLPGCACMTRGTFWSYGSYGHYDEDGLPLAFTWRQVRNLAHCPK